LPHVHSKTSCLTLIGSAPRIVRNWLDGFWLRSYAESAKYKPETIHETH
jgi:hypothetical protein